MPKKDPSRVGLPLGGINDGPVAKQAIFAREQSLNSIKYLAEAEDEGLAHTLGNSPTMMIEKSGKDLLQESFVSPNSPRNRSQTLAPQIAEASFKQGTQMR